jgi:diacylglycerol kinase family enzyme
MKSLAIINPASSGGGTGRRLAAILRMLKGAYDDYAVSSKPGECVRLARNAGAYERLIAVGGDGTACEILRGMDRARQVLGIVPAGTGNSLARDFRLKTIQHAAAALISVRVIPIDLMSVEFSGNGTERQHWFSCSMLSVGYAARVTDVVNRHLKRLGRFAYPLAAIFCAGKGNTFPVRLSYEDSAPVAATRTCVLLGNTRHVGNFEAFPAASCEDGELDAAELRSGFAGQNLQNISILTRGYFYDPAVRRRFRRLHITLERPRMLMIDGEILPGVTDVRISVVPRGVMICSPA